MQQFDWNGCHQKFMTEFTGLITYTYANGTIKTHLLDMGGKHFDRDMRPSNSYLDPSYADMACGRLRWDNPRRKSLGIPYVGAPTAISCSECQDEHRACVSRVVSRWSQEFYSQESIVEDRKALALNAFVLIEHTDARLLDVFADALRQGGQRRVVAWNAIVWAFNTVRPLG